MKKPINKGLQKAQAQANYYFLTKKQKQGVTFWLFSELIDERVIK